MLYERLVKYKLSYCPRCFLLDPSVVKLQCRFWLLILYSIFFNSGGEIANGLVGGGAWDAVQDTFY